MCGTVVLIDCHASHTKDMCGHGGDVHISTAGHFGLTCLWTAERCAQICAHVFGHREPLTKHSRNLDKWHTQNKVLIISTSVHRYS